MEPYMAKVLIFFLSIVSRLFFGFTPLLVSRKFLTNKATDSLTSKTVSRPQRLGYKSENDGSIILFNVLVGISGFVMFELRRRRVASHLFCSFDARSEREPFRPLG